MQAKSRQILIAVSLFAAAIAGSGAAYMYQSTGTAVADAQPSRTVRMVGIATGEVDHGAPVYRLPSVTVAASRAVELARIEREDAAARAAAPVVAAASR